MIHGSLVTSSPNTPDDTPNILGAVHKALSLRLEKAGIEPAAHEARIVLCHRLGMDWHDFHAQAGLIISQSSLIQIESDMAQRLGGKPLSKILGVQEFYGREFHVSADVLDPRQDTETLIDIALKRFDKASPIRVLELGVGSGCILVTLLCELPEASGIGVDFSPKALEMARKNAKRHDVLKRSEWFESDWYSAVPAEQFDLVVSNPPYIRSTVIPELAPEVKNHDPILALDGGDDGLDAYKKIFSGLKNFLKPDGIALFEIGYDQSEDVMRLSRESRFMQCNVHPDLAGQPRVAEICSGDKL